MRIVARFCLQRLNVWSEGGPDVIRPGRAATRGGTDSIRDPAMLHPTSQTLMEPLVPSEPGGSGLRATQDTTRRATISITSGFLRQFPCIARFRMGDPAFCARYAPYASFRTPCITVLENSFRNLYRVTDRVVIIS